MHVKYAARTRRSHIERTGSRVRAGAAREDLILSGSARIIINCSMAGMPRPPNLRDKSSYFGNQSALLKLVWTVPQSKRSSSESPKPSSQEKSSRVRHRISRRSVGRFEVTATPAAEPLCLLLSLRTPTKFGLSTFKHEKGNVGRSNRACPGFDRNGQRQRQGLALFRGATAIPH